MFRDFTPTEQVQRVQLPRPRRYILRTRLGNVNPSFMRRLGSEVYRTTMSTNFDLLVATDVGERQ